MLVFILNCFVVALTVIIHYEFLYRISVHIPRMSVPHRQRIVIGVFIALIAHAVEIWVFAISFYLMNKAEGWGSLTGNYDGSLLDSAYFSFTTYTTLGFGDIEPIGVLRYLVGIEALTGLVLITWTASFLYFEMQKHWSAED